MQKSSKNFTLSTSQLNSFGFRLLTSGADLGEFRQNPIMLWMHNRPTKGTRDEVLPLGYWEDIKVEGDRITAVPVFDDKDEYAMAIYHKVENGTIRTCSAGVVPLAYSEEKKDLLPGQTRPTVTRWKLKEGSLTDIGSNPGALAVALYDPADRLINLSGSTLEATLPALRGDWDLLFRSGGLEAVRLSDPTRYSILYLEKFGKLPAKLTAPQVAQPAPPAQVVAHLYGRTWDELHRSGELAALKLNDPVVYSIKYLEKFGKAPANV